MKRKSADSAQDGAEGPTDREIEDALNEAALDAVKAHLDAGVPMVVWKNGEVAHVHPSTIRIPKRRNKDGT